MSILSTLSTTGDPPAVLWAKRMPTRGNFPTIAEPQQLKGFIIGVGVQKLKITWNRLAKSGLQVMQ
jgi:hypothetical protein